MSRKTEKVIWCIVIKLKKYIETSLKQQFNREKRSRLVMFNFTREEGDLLEIDAVVNTVDYMKDADLEQAEQKIGKILKRKVRVSVDQIKVKSKGLIPQEVKTKPVMVTPRPAEETLREEQNRVLPLIRQVCAKAEDVLSPSPITDCSVAFQDITASLLLQLKIRRDAPPFRRGIDVAGKIFQFFIEYAGPASRGNGAVCARSVF